MEQGHVSETRSIDHSQNEIIGYTAAVYAMSGKNRQHPAHEPSYVPAAIRQLIK